MSNLTYNPNIDIPPYHGFDNNDGPRAMDFPSDGNFRGGRQPDIYFDARESRYEPQYNDQRINPQINQQINPQINPRREQYMESNSNIYYEPYDTQISRPKRRMKERMTSLSDKSDKINWMLILKKVVIYMLLFLVFNHVKTHQIICGLIPFLNNNELLCMTFKGLIFAVIIILLQIYLA